MSKAKNIWGGKLNTLLILALIILVAFKNLDSNPEKEGILPNNNIVHIGIVVEDIETSLDKWLKLLGLEKRPDIRMVTGHKDNPTQYKGKPSDARAKIVFIRAENIQIELLEPIGKEDSFWQDFLDQHGPAVHHVGLNVKNLGETYVDIFEKEGYPLLQHGGWNGGEYGYMDSQKDLGVVIELLENYSK